MSDAQPPVADDDTLLRQGLGGDRAAWGELYRRHREQLRDEVAKRLSFLRRRTDASDVIQEMFTELLATEASATFDGAELTAGAWLRGVVANFVHRAIERHWTTQKRSLRRETHAPGVDAAHAAPGPSPSGEALRVEEAERFESALSILSVSERMVVGLRVLDGLKYPQIAWTLGMTKDAARMCYGRAMRKLQAHLGSREHPS